MSITIDVPAKLDIDIFKGDDFQRAFWVTDDDDAVVDLTGYTIEGELREENDKTSTLIDTFAFVISEALGKFVAVLTDDNTAAYTVNNGFFSIRLIDPLGIKTTYAYGEATILKTPTA